MPITPNQQAPSFSATDVYDKPVSLAQFKGKKVLLTFFRTAGCPVCNLRFHALAEQWEWLKSKDVIFIAVYASVKENMLRYLRSSYPNDRSLYPIFIANTDQSLYKLYKTEQSTWKLISSLLFHGGFGDVNKGKGLFKEPIKDDGPLNLINADFLIDETGKVARAYFGRYSGDFIPIADIRKFAQGS
jgi:thiol-disulfide isomerase/thioredoxin